ncbi:MAG: rhomboid family intramembrane serine protease [Solirubrobacteraceae bacterium]|nr:rhomboid family intramembrane serine protease [Solirubrobacteraceae bacterium]
MARGADLFVVCKNCGSEVSPYVTECPYCGQRVRKRAPKIERGGPKADPIPKPRRRRRRSPGTRGRFQRLRPAADASSLSERPVATIALVAASFLVYLVYFAGAFAAADVIVVGKLDGDWWKLVTAPFLHVGSGGGIVLAGGAYQFATMVAVGIYGTLLERRHGPVAVLLVALLSGAGGMLVAAAIETFPIAAGANGLALGLLAAWVVPDLLAWRRNRAYEGDLLGTAVIAAVLLLMPVAVEPANAYAGVAGGLIGLLLGFPLARVAART